MKVKAMKNIKKNKRGNIMYEIGSWKWKIDFRYTLKNLWKSRILEKMNVKNIVNEMEEYLKKPKTFDLALARYAFLVLFHKELTKYEKYINLGYEWKNYLSTGGCNYFEFIDLFDMNIDDRFKKLFINHDGRKV